MSTFTEAELELLERQASHYAHIVKPKLENIPDVCARVVPALVAEVRRLRAELEQTQHGMEAAYMSGRADARKEAEAENAALRDKLAPLCAAAEGLENDGFMASAFSDNPAPAYSQRWWEAVALNAAKYVEENAALRDSVEALEKWETSASCCVICNNSPADKITLHETDAPWEIYAPFEVCLCREHQRALIAGVQEAVKKMKEERDAQVSS